MANQSSQRRRIPAASVILAVVFGAIPALLGAVLAVLPGSSTCHAVFSNAGTVSSCSEGYTWINLIMGLPLLAILLIVAGALVGIRAGSKFGLALLLLGSTLCIGVGILLVISAGVYGYPFAILMGLAACCGIIAFRVGALRRGSDAARRGAPRAIRP
jgi:hypothetical protein